MNKFRGTSIVSQVLAFGVWRFLRFLEDFYLRIFLEQFRVVQLKLYQLNTWGRKKNMYINLFIIIQCMKKVIDFFFLSYELRAIQ